MSGREPTNPNEFLVEPGERGIQKHTLPPGTYYPNPYEQNITSIDIRSHRFDMMKERVEPLTLLDCVQIYVQLARFDQSDAVPDLIVDSDIDRTGPG